MTTKKWYALSSLLCVLLLAATCQTQNDCQGPAQKDCVCAEIYMPVCGCDGKTYGNECKATCNGIKRTTKGACNETSKADETPKEQLVKTDDTSTTAKSSVENDCLLPNAKENCPCTREYRPVCGCDRQTYPNPCVAKCKVKSFIEGTCESHKVATPTIDESKTTEKTTTSPPPPTEKNNHPTTTPKSDCKKTTPNKDCVCAQMYDPVCGCDGKTYSNACVADCRVNSYVKGACK